MSTQTRCRVWFTYRGQPRQFQPWCECGTWRAPAWYTKETAQDLTKYHLADMARR
jgi:hypothetical protein